MRGIGTSRAQCERVHRLRVRRRRRICFEALEERALLATVAWAIDSNGFWDVPSNWSTGTVPQSGDDVVLDRPAGNFTITHRSGTSAPNSITGAERLVISGGVLDVANQIQVDGGIALSGGTLKNADVSPGSAGVGMEVTSAGGTLDGVTLGVNTTLLTGTTGIGNQVTVLNGLTLANGITLRLERSANNQFNSSDVGLNFSGAVQRLDGSGIVELFSAFNPFSGAPAEVNDVRVRPTGGGTLTIASGITVRNATNSRFATLGDVAGGALVLEGTVQAQSAGQSFFVTGSTVSNTGTLASLAGELILNHLTGNVNGTLIGNGDLDLDGTYTLNLPVEVPSGSLTVRGDWSNASTITQSGGTIHLGGTFTVADMGAFPGSAGTVNIFGVLDAPSATLPINAARRWQLSAGTLRGVTVQGDSGALLEVTSVGGTFDDLTLGVNTTLLAGTTGIGNQVTVLNGLTLANGITLRLERSANNQFNSSDVGLNFSGAVQRLDGSGIVELFSAFNPFSGAPAEVNDVRVRPTGGGTLTIGSGITVRNATNSRFATLGDVAGGALVLEGTVQAQSAGQSFFVTGSTVSNTGTLASLAGELIVNHLTGNVHGTLIGSGDLDLDGTYTFNLPVEVPSGSLTLRGDWSNASTITQSGGTIHLGGTFNVADMGSFPGSAGTVNIFGVLDAPGATLPINAARRWQLSAGTLRGVTVQGDSGALLEVTSAGGTFDDLTLGVNTTLLTGTTGIGNQVTVLNGLTLANGITLRLDRSANNQFNSSDVGLNFSGAVQRLDGSGIVELFSAFNPFLGAPAEVNDVRVRPTGGGTLTIASGITVRNATNSRFATLGDVDGGALVLEGTVQAQSAGQSFFVTGSTVSNTGTLASLAGELALNHLTGNVHGTLIGNGDLDLDGTYAFNLPVEVPSGSLTVRGEWSNESTITQSGGTIHLGGTFTVADMGAFPGSAGTVSIFGVLDAPGATLPINAARHWQVSAGTLRGVTVQGDSGALLEVASAGGTFDDLTLGVNTTLLTGTTGIGNQVTVLNGLTLANGITLRLDRSANNSFNSSDVGLNFSGAVQRLDGSGIVELFSAFNPFSGAPAEVNDVRVRPTGGGTLTIGSGITVRNATNSRFATLGDVAGGALVLEGTVQAQSAGQSLFVTGSTVSNTGTLASLAGELILNHLTGNVNETLIGSGDLDLDGTYTFNLPVEVPSGSLTLRGDWSNASTITQSGGTIHLGSTFSVADMGSFPGSAGTVNIFGVLDAPGATLPINAARRWQLSAGTLRGVTVQGDSGALLEVASAGGTFDDLTLGVNTTLVTGTTGIGNQVTVLNGLTLANGITLRLDRSANNSFNSSDVGLNFSGAVQRLDGSGIVELFSAFNPFLGSPAEVNDVRVRPTGGGTLTIGAGITVRNAANSRFATLGDVDSGALVLEGTVQAQSVGQSFFVTGSTVSNTGTLASLAGELIVNHLTGNVHGTLIGSGDLDLDGTYTFNLPVEVPSGSLTLRGDWSNASTITQSGGTIHLGGTFNVADMGAFPGSAGTVSIFGVLDAPGATLPINAARRWQLSAGTLRGVAVQGDSGALLEVTSAGGTFDDLTLGVNTTLLTGTTGIGNQVTVLNGLTLASGITLRLDRSANNQFNSSDVGLNFSGAVQRLDGSGIVELFSAFTPFSSAPAEENDVRVRPTGGGTLTIGSGITVRNATNSRFTTLGDATSGALLIEGTVIAQSAGQELRVTASAVTNKGHLGASAGTLDVIPPRFHPATGTVFALSAGQVLVRPTDSTNYQVNGSFLGDTWTVDLVGGNWRASSGGILRLLYNGDAAKGVQVRNLAASVELSGENSHIYAGSSTSAYATTSALQNLAGVTGEGSLLIENGRDYNVAGPFSNYGAVIVGGGSTWTMPVAEPYRQFSGRTVIDGRLIASAGVQLQGGILGGSGEIQARVFNGGGTVAPGNSPGILEIFGDYTQTADGTLLLEIAGRDPDLPEFDRLRVIGNAFLDGTLRVELLDAFEPTPGDTFPVLTAAARVGQFAVTEFPAPGGAAREFHADYGSNGLTLLTRFVPPLGLRFATTTDGILGTGSVHPLDVAIDASGNAYVTGRFEGTVDFDLEHSSAGDTLVAPPDGSSFLAKYDPDGQLLWVQAIEASASDVRGDLSIDARGNLDPSDDWVYATGPFVGFVDYASGPPVVTGLDSSFLLKVDALGNRLALRALADTKTQDVAVGPNSDVVLVGSFGSLTGSADFDTGGGLFSLTSAGLADAFVTQFASDLSFLRAARLGGVGEDAVAGVAIDSANQVWITGQYHEATTGLAALTPFGDPLASNGDVFVLKLQPSATSYTAQVARAYGAPGDDAGIAIAVDGNDNAIVAGNFHHAIDFDAAVNHAFTLVSSGDSDLFALKLAADGEFLWARSIGGYRDDMVTTLTTDAINNVYLGGTYNDIVDFDPFDDSYNLQTTSTRAFVARYDAAGRFNWATDLETAGGSTSAVTGLAVAGIGRVVVTGIADAVGGAIDFDPTTGIQTAVPAGASRGFLWSLDQKATPQVALLGLPPGPLSEGATLALASEVTDADSLYFTYAWTVTRDGADFSAGDGSALGLLLSDQGLYQVTLTATDEAGLFHSVTANITVVSAPPVLQGTAFGVGIATGTAAAGDQYGGAIAAADGFLLVGSPMFGADDAGAAFLYDDAGNLLHSFFGPSANAQFGFSVAIVDGYAVVGAPTAAIGGAVYVYSLVTGSLLQLITNTEAAAGDQFGAALLATGNLLAIGAPGTLRNGLVNVGEAYLYHPASGRRLQRFRNPTPNADDRFGTALATVGGNLVLGTPGDDSAGVDAGAAYVFDLDRGRLLEQLFNPYPGFSGSAFGSVLTAADLRIAIGAPLDDSSGTADQGSVHLFDLDTRSPSFGELLTTLRNPNVAAARFGSSLAASGPRLLVGAPRDGVGIVNAGSAFLIDIDPASPGYGTLTTTLKKPTPMVGDAFGSAIALLGDQVVVGASFDDRSALDGGGLYRYAPSGFLRLSSSNVDESGTVTIVASFVDPGVSDTHTVVVEWGDSTDPERIAVVPGARSFSAVHRYLDDDPSGTASDPKNIRVRVLDDTRDLLVGLGDQIDRLDASTSTELDTFIAAGTGGLANASAMAVGPNGDVFIASGSVGTNSVLRFSGATGEFLGTFIPAGAQGTTSPADLLFGPDGDLYYADASGDRVLRFDGNTGAFVNSVGIADPRAIAFGSDGTLFAASQLAGVVLQFDGTVVTTLATLSDVLDLAISEDGLLYALTANGLPQVRRLDATTGDDLGTLAEPPLTGSAGSLQLASDGALYVGDPAGGLYRYDTQSGELLSSSGRVAGSLSALSPLDEASGNITVVNVAPTVSVQPVANMTANQYSLAAVVSDAGPLDTHTYSWSITGGTAVGSASAATFTYSPTSTTVNVVLTVTDDDTGSVTSRTLIVFGTTIADSIAVNTASVVVNGVSTVYPVGIQHVIVYGLEGDDTISAAAMTGTGLPVTLIGGRGSDTLTGGPQHDVLLGNSPGDYALADPYTGDVSSDSLAGGAGNDTLDAGLGDDTMRGGIGDDYFVQVPGSSDMLFDEAGVDTIDFALAFSGITFNLAQTGTAQVVNPAEVPTNQHTVEINGEFENLYGSQFSDTLAGNKADNAIRGGQGNDVIFGGFPLDTILGPLGHDGDDSLLGGAGNDTVQGGYGNDLIFGGDIPTTVTGTLGPDLDDDSLIGGFGNDTVQGGHGNDLIFGGEAPTTIPGALAPDRGEDSLVGGLGNDTILGGYGNDLIFGGDDPATVIGTLGPDRGDDSLIGGFGNDTIHGGHGNDLIFGGDVPTTTPGALGPDTGDDSLLGGVGNDTILGGHGNDLIFGGDDPATVIGTLGPDAGDDLLIGGIGNDSVYGGHGNDLIFGGDDPATVIGTLGPDPGDDSLVGGVGNDTVLGGHGNDLIFGGDLPTTVTGTLGPDPGDDSLIGGLGNDTVYGGHGNDLIFGGDDPATVIGTLGPDMGDDSLIGGAGNDSVVGGHGNDLIFGGDDLTTVLGTLGPDLDDDTLVGGFGNDTMVGGHGNDLIFGGDAPSTVIGSLGPDPGNDSLVGGAGNDTLLGSHGNDLIFGGAGNDLLAGEQGHDLFEGGSGIDRISESQDADIILAPINLTIGGDSELLFDIEQASLGGGAGNNRIDASAFMGPVSLFGFGGDDTLLGGPQGDQLFGGTGNDSLVGGAGDDVLDGGDGDDVMDGGEANDTYLQKPGSHDTFIDAEGIDSLDLSSAVFAFTLDLGNAATQVVDAAGNSLSLVGTFENVRGSSYGDVIKGNAQRNILYGGGGIDSVDGRDGADTLQGGFPQLVYLDFETATGRGEKQYSIEERNAIQDRLEEDFGAPFSVTFTQTAPAIGRFTLVVINAGSPDDSEPLIGGVAYQLDWRNVEAGSRADINVNGFLGRRGQPAASSENFVGLTSSVIAHELGHLFGLRHSDSFGPLGIDASTGLPYGVYDQLIARSVSRDEVLAGISAAGPDPRMVSYQLKHGPVLLGPSVHAGSLTLVPHPAPQGVIFDQDRPIATFTVNEDGTVALAGSTMTDGPVVLAGTLDAANQMLHLEWSAPPAASAVRISYDYDALRPGYRGPLGAFETPLHLMASPASVGSSVQNALANTSFGERELIKMAFADVGHTVREEGVATAAAPAAVGGSARDLGRLPNLAVPDRLAPGTVNVGQSLRVAALNVLGTIERTTGGLGPSEDDIYAFEGHAGELLTVELASAALPQRLSSTIDGILRVFGPGGVLLDYYGRPAVNDDGLDTQDSLLLDVILPVDGRYFIQVDTFTSAQVPDTDTGTYELFLYTFTPSSGTRQGGAGDTVIGGPDSDLLIGSSGDDRFIADVLEDRFLGLSPFDFLGLSIEPTAIITNLPAQIAEGQTWVLDGSLSEAPSGAVVHYHWNVTRDGEVVAAGEEATFSFAPDDNGQYSISLTVTDELNATNTHTEIIEVTSAAPTAEIEQDGPRVYGEAIVVSLLNALDPSAADTAAGLRYAFATSPDELTDVSYANSSSIASFEFDGLSAGDHLIYARVMDKDGSFTQYSTAVHVDRRLLDGSIAVAEKMYDGTAAATITGRMLIGVIPGDDVQYVGGVAFFESKHVGEFRTVTATGLQLAGAQAANYLVSDNAVTSASITPRPITSVVTVAGKVYDATRFATIVDRSIEGTIDGDDVALAGGTATFDDKHAGENKRATVTGLSLVGLDATNYEVSESAVAFAEITRLAITGTITAANKTYDGTATATITSRSLVGVIAGDDVEYVGGTAVFSDKNVGFEKTVVATGQSLAGADAGNYTVSDVSEIFASIHPKNITGVITVVDKVYDGTTDATIASASLAGVIAGDDVRYVGGIAHFEDKNVGVNKSVTATQLGLSGSDAGNYSVNDTATAQAAITPLALIGNITVADRTYDGTTTAVVTSRNLQGVIAGDDVAYVGGAATFSDKNAGLNKEVTANGLGLSGVDAGNYTVNSTAVSTAAITRRALTGTIAVADKVYDGTTAATIVDRTLAGVFAGDDVQYVGGTAGFLDKNAESNKPVTATGLGLSGVDADNYTVNSTAVSTAAITRRALTGTIAVADKVYDGTTAATIVDRTLAGVIAGDDVQYVGGSANFTDPNVGANKTVTATALGLAGADAGNYTVNSSAATTASILAMPSTLKISAIIINDGDLQRSNIETIAIQFSEQVNLAALIANGQITTAVQLYSAAGQVMLPVSRYRYNSSTFTLTIDLTTDGFGDSQATLLADGQYELRLATGSITVNDRPSETLLDDDGFQDAIRRIAFHRLYGDLDGDGTTRPEDLDEFFAHFDGRAIKKGDPDYHYSFDYNGNGVINRGDYNAWQRYFDDLP